MRFIRDIFADARRARRPAISFEFFPTKTPEGERTLLEKTIPALGALKPDFCSVTYGAGGSTARDDADDRRSHSARAGAHGDGAHDVRQRDAGGDRGRARTGARARHHATSWRCAAIRRAASASSARPTAASSTRTSSSGSSRRWTGFRSASRGFPKGTSRSTEGKHADWQHLKHKIDQGADFVITQLFFNNRDYFEFRDYLTSLGVTVPLVPGIMPILSAAQIKRIVALCGADLPAAFVSELDRHAGDDEAVVRFGIDYATRQCEELLREGAPGLHFYTLNKARSTSEIAENLNLASLSRS